jgi:hypothetical protein
MIGLTAAPSALAATNYMYWSDDTSWGTNSIGRANADASGVLPYFIRESAYSLATAGPYIYFVSSGSGSIGRANLDGTNVDPTFIMTPGGTGGLAVSGQYIYWSDSGGISRANVDGTGITIDYIAGITASVHGTVASLAVDSRYIYWGDQESGAGSSRIGRANLDGTGVSATFITGLDYVDGIAVDSQYIFWANDSLTPTVGRADLDGSNVQPTLVGGTLDQIGSIGQIAVDDQYVYWADYSQHTIGRANLDGTGFTPAFTATGANPHGLALSGSPTGAPGGGGSGGGGGGSGGGGGGSGGSGGVGGGSGGGGGGSGGSGGGGGGSSGGGGGSSGGGGGSSGGGGGSSGGGVVECDPATGTCTQVTSCSPGANVICNGEVSYSTQSGGPAGNVSTAAKTGKSRFVIIGRAIFAIPAGRSQLVRVRLNRSGMRLLRLHHQLRVLETITSHDKAGHQWIHRRWIALRLQLAKPRQHRKR